MMKSTFSIRIGQAKFGQPGRTLVLELSPAQKLQLSRLIGRPPDQIELSLEELTNRVGWREMYKTE